MIGIIICWWRGEHNWTDWWKVVYTDDRTHYWTRICLRCGKINSTLENPNGNTMGK